MSLSRYVDSDDILICNTIGCRYNAVHYDIISPTSRQQLRQNMNQFEFTKDTLYLALTGELSGVFWENFVDNLPR